MSTEKPDIRCSVCRRHEQEGEKFIAGTEKGILCPEHFSAYMDERLTGRDLTYRDSTPLKGEALDKARKFLPASDLDAIEWMNVDGVVATLEDLTGLGWVFVGFSPSSTGAPACHSFRSKTTPLQMEVVYEHPDGWQGWVLDAPFFEVSDCFSTPGEAILGVLARCRLWKKALSILLPKDET